MEDAMTYEKVKETIDELRNRAKNSQAIDNESYRLWQDSPLNVKALEIFLANYFARTINTVSRVCDVMKALLSDPVSLIKNPEYAKAVIHNMENIQDELGDGKNKTSHPLLMTKWINDLLTRLGSENVPIENSYTKFVTQETNDFTKIQAELYASSSIQTVVGVSFAQEVFADFMMKQLFNGYKANYREFFENEEEFLSTYPYFTVHVTGAEENHGNLAADLVRNVCHNEYELNQIVESYNIFENITIGFWNGISNRIDDIHNGEYIGQPSIISTNVTLDC